MNTENPFDLAIVGSGFFSVRSPANDVLLTRAGQFMRDQDGRLVTSGGLVLQADGGGDLVLKSNNVTIAADGAVMEDGAPAAKLAILDFAPGARVQRSDEGGFFADAGEMVQLAHPTVKQGAIEASNVSTGDEMVAIMEALRRAEAGQRLVNVYDDLMGRALQAFGQV